MSPRRWRREELEHAIMNVRVATTTHEVGGAHMHRGGGGGSVDIDSSEIRAPSIPPRDADAKSESKTYQGVDPTYGREDEDMN